MARSTCIYVVVDSDQRNHPVQAAFTVKHELVTWGIRRVENGHITKDSDLYVIRCGDGVMQGEPKNEGAPRLWDLVHAEQK